MSRRRLMTCALLLIVGSIACWYFPLFHVRPLAELKTEAIGSSDVSGSNGVSFQLANGTPANDTSRKLKADATEVTQLWGGFDADKSQVRSKYGRQAGLGGPWYFVIRGHGTVEKIEKNRAILKVDNSSRRACLELGAPLDSTVREAIGVKASDFSNSQDFNAVASELNRHVEQDVLAPNRSRLQRGVIVEFIGCAKISRDSDFDPLCLIPTRLDIGGMENLEPNANPGSGGGKPQ
jgi:predicted lipoprotein